MGRAVPDVTFNLLLSTFGTPQVRASVNGTGEFVVVEGDELRLKRQSYLIQGCRRPLNHGSFHVF